MIFIGGYFDGQHEQEVFMYMGLSDYRIDEMTEIAIPEPYRPAILDDNIPPTPNPEPTPILRYHKIRLPLSYPWVHVWVHESLTPAQAFERLMNAYVSQKRRKQ